MDIPINVDVFCQGNACGHTLAVVLNPVADIVTHLVVKEKEAPHTQRMVPLDLVQESSPQGVSLKCDLATFQALKPFDDVQFIQAIVPHYVAAYGTYYMGPFVIREREDVPVHHQHIPEHELPVSRGARVYSSDEYHIGQVDEFLVDRSNGHITHLILREGHLWGQKDVSIPVSEIDLIEDYHVYLKLDKKQVGELPTIPVQRKWA